MRQQKIIDIINTNLAPSHLEVVNESDMHQGPLGRETHFKLVAVSDKFSDLSLVQRHQLVYKLLDSELQAGLHALALKLYSVTEWEKNKSNMNLSSPECSHKK